MLSLLTLGTAVVSSISVLGGGSKTIKTLQLDDSNLLNPISSLLLENFPETTDDLITDIDQSVSAFGADYAEFAIENGLIGESDYDALQEYIVSQDDEPSNMGSILYPPNDYVDNPGSGGNEFVFPPGDDWRQNQDHEYLIGGGESLTDPEWSYGDTDGSWGNRQNLTLPDTLSEDEIRAAYGEPVLNFNSNVGWFEYFLGIEVNASFCVSLFNVVTEFFETVFEPMYDVISFIYDACAASVAASVVICSIIDKIINIFSDIILYFTAFFASSTVTYIIGIVLAICLSVALVFFTTCFVAGAHEKGVRIGIYFSRVLITPVFELIE